MQKLLPLYVTAHIFLQDRKDAFHERRQNGQGTIEYVGLALLVAAVVVTLSQASVGDWLKQRVQSAVQHLDSILG